MKNIFIAIFALIFCLQVKAQQSDETPSDTNTITNLCGLRVVLQYGLPMDEEGGPRHLPQSDAITQCYLVTKDKKQKEFPVSWKLDEYTVLVPSELAPFRKEGTIQKGTLMVLYEPTGILRKNRLSITYDSRDKLRGLDFRGDLKVNHKDKTIIVILTKNPETTKKQVEPVN